MELPHYNCPITVTSSEAPSRSRIRQMWNIRGATAVDVCQDLALGSHQAAGVQVHFDRKRQNRLALIFPTVV